MARSHEAAQVRLQTVADCDRGLISPSRTVAATTTRRPKGRTATETIEQPHREDPVANTILRTLRQNRPNGLNRRAIFFLFHRNYNAAKLDAALGRLWQEGKVRREQHVRTAAGGGGGRPAEMWFATFHD